MADVLCNALRDEHNSNVFPDLRKFEKSPFNILLIRRGLVTDVKILALATTALSNACGEGSDARQQAKRCCMIAG